MNISGQPYSILLIFIAMVYLMACKSNTEPQPIDQEVIPEDSVVTVEPTLVSFDNWTDGSYSSNRMAEDFGNVSNYSNTEERRSAVIDNRLKITLLKEALSASGGVIADIDISRGDQYLLQYDIKFDSAFEWSRGGKLPGLGGGEAYTGGTPATAGDGWSFRVMWRYGSTTNNGVPYLIPYAYFVDQPSDFGHNFGSSARFDIKKDQWYTVSVRAKMNTGTNSDGEIEFKVNGTVVFKNTNFRWATESKGREVDLILWRFFRGGSSDDWKASIDSDVYIDNVYFEKID